MRRRGFLSRLIGDKRGVAAVEFAIVAPVMIAMYLGMVEVCGGFMAQKRMSHVTALVADLVSQEEAVSQENMSRMFNIGEAIMQPFSSVGLDQRVRSITQNSASTTVNWVYTNNAASFSDDEVTLPEDLIEEGQSIIMSEAVYKFDSPVNYLIPGTMTFKARYFLRPRVVDAVLCSDCTGPTP